MSYCTACGQPRAGPAPFCTACGAAFAGPAGPGPGEPGRPPDDDFFSHLFRPDPAPAGTDPTRLIPAPPGSGPARPGLGPPPWPPPPGPRPGAAGRRIVMAVGVLVLLAAAGTGAWLVFRHPHGSGPARAAGGTPARASPRSPSASASASSPTAGTGRGLVTVAPGVSRQAAEPRAVAFLNDYFTAINRHSYRRFAVLLGPQARRTLPAPAFYAGYRTTTDSAATLTGLSPAGGGRVVAYVAFTSHQAPSDTPSHSRCTHWRVVLVLVPRHGRLVLGPPLPGYHAAYQAC